MRFPIFLGTCALLLVACGPANVRQDDGLPLDHEAAALFEQGQFAEAARMWLSLAAGQQEADTSFHLRAAEALLEAGDTVAADRILAGVHDTPDTNEQGAYTHLLRARIALARSMAETALMETGETVPTDLPLRLQISWHRTRADALAATGRYLDAVRTRINMTSYALDEEEALRNTRQIWNLLVNSELDDLMAYPAAGEPDLSAWLALGIISKTLLTESVALNRALDGWSAEHAGHPAYPAITSEIRQIAGTLNLRPEHIALLLPLTGVYERYAERIRDGFIAAWFNEPDYRPHIAVYNTDVPDIMQVYQTAIDEGAELIVGPLQKDAVRVLAEKEGLPVRILALNQTDISGDPPVSRPGFGQLPDMIQFGLPPEDEAYQVAVRGIMDGYTRALVVTPADEFGERVYQAFTSAWEGGGGIVLERVTYDAGTTDFITPIKQLLNLDSSEARISQLRQRLGRNLMNSERLRQDAQFVFIAAPNLAARQIVPHLRFFRAQDLPIYSLSAIYGGTPNPMIDSDLDGVEFVDMPWLFQNPGEQGLYDEIRRNWDGTGILFPRYYAFGIDAYRLITRIGELTLNPGYRFNGMTGRLQMDDTGRIHRELIWARFVDGIPRLLDQAELN